jgi:hypothetical protein
VIKSEPYLRHVREFACLICQRYGVDAHHLRRGVSGVLRGFSMKASGDDMAVPLCREHHMESHRYGNELDFWVGYGIDPVDWANRNYEKWNQKRSQ